MAANRWAWAALGAVLVAGIARVALVWPDLPPTMASHFDAGGRANGWMSKQAFFASMGIIEVGLCALLASTGWWARWLPVSLINLPNRDYWLAPERKDESLRRLGRAMAWFAVVMGVFLVGILELTIQANLRGTALSTLPFTALLLVMFGGTIAVIVVLYSTFRMPK